LAGASASVPAARAGSGVMEGKGESCMARYPSVECDRPVRGREDCDCG
jgi:hypothetical protein